LGRDIEAAHLRNLLSRPRSSAYETATYGLPPSQYFVLTLAQRSSRRPATARGEDETVSGWDVGGRLLLPPTRGRRVSVGRCSRGAGQGAPARLADARLANRRSRESERRLGRVRVGFGEEGRRDRAGVSGEDRDLDRVAGVVREVGCEAGIEVGVLERDEPP